MNPPGTKQLKIFPPLWSGRQFLFGMGRVVCWEGWSLLLAALLTYVGDAQLPTCG